MTTTRHVILDDESKRVGEEAKQVGEVLRAIAQELRDPIPDWGGDINEVEEYFFKRIWRGIKRGVKAVGKGVGKVAKEVGKGVGHVAKGIITSKAADIVKKVFEKKLAVYALEDKNTYNNFLQDVAEELDRIGEALTKNRSHL
ncbi:hypothetical protein HPB49_011759 [Dermacentor silvarum]|uniref:Uncharacterized protein n=1 Tax=Dermacentor silvarum TaxID=543639 RepID=A0ACB8DCW6_DERSI|nr:hypothetical protein HPB49_011759 [Dermacentor silvarum]